MISIKLENLSLEIEFKMNIRKTEELKKAFKGKVEFGIPMNRFTYYRIGGKTWAMVFPENLDDISEAVSFCKKNKIPYLPIGKGSNLLVSDRGFNGVVINLAKAFNRFQILDNSESGYKWIFSQGGANLPLMIRELGNEGIGNLEFACGIPGTVGGGIKGNAGSFNKCISDRLEKLQVVDSEGNIKELPKKDISFGYRTCGLPKGYIIAGAWFKLKKKKKQTIDRIISRYQKIRKLSQPCHALTAGCVFKNPQGYSAGKLIELSGFKGAQCGDARISTKHANFIINEGRARAKEVYKLICDIRKKIWENFGIRLELEIVLVGEGFKDSSRSRSDG